jgi:hypothetical protein
MAPGLREHVEGTVRKVCAIPLSGEEGVNNSLTF